MTCQVDWNLARDDWERLLAECPAATLFHTPSWCEAQAGVLGGRARAAHFRFDDGLWALWPMTEKPMARGHLAFAVSGDAGCYGGPLFAVVPQESHLATFCRKASSRWPSWDIVGNPFGLVPLPLAGRPNFTHVVSPFSLRLSRGCKARINKARREGVTWKMGSVDDFLPLYGQAVSRWSERLTWRRPDAYFRAILDLPQTRCFVALRDEEPISAMIVGSYGKIAHYISGAAGTDALPCGASNLLLSEILLWAKDRGIEAVDLGPSAGLEGVQQFKESFGAQRVDFPVWSRRSSAHWLYDRVKELAQV